jgi:hypothetical protein
VHVPLPSNITVASNIDAAGDVTINNVNVLNVASPLEQSSERLRLEQAVVGGVKDRVETCKAAIVLYNWHAMPRNTATWFWNNLWFGKLEHCVEKGFVLLCADETPDGDFRKDNLAAYANCLIKLPSQFIGQDRSNAVEDISRLLMSSTKEAAELTRARADSLLSEWRDQPERVHSGLSWHLLRLEYD